jgi:hypothetical protein
MSTNFHLAPPPKLVDGLLAVPVDIQSINASFLFDGNSQSATADATIAYTMGVTAGHPIFDCRQTITQAWLDNVLFPVTQLSSHNFGAGTFSELRIIESLQTPGSVHTLRVQLSLGIPQSQVISGYIPVLEWLNGPKLHFRFGLSDLNAGRYLESWLPANLLFDQYTIDLDIQIINTMAAHSLLTNGTVNAIATNHWLVSFPQRFTALSPMLEIHATDRLEFFSDTVSLPVSGKTVTIETAKLIGTITNLPTQVNTIKNLLIANENEYGSYLHENRFVAFFNGGGMEYEGGTTTSSGALLHETFHSWFARGIKPASQSDGWWDEAYTSYHDAGADDAVAFDFTDSPVLLCSRDPWQRRTPSNSYADGERFWQGVAAMLGIDRLNSLMSDLYNKYKGKPLSTMMLEEFLLSKSGDDMLVDAFHRFVYNFSNSVPQPDLWMKDDPAHTGADGWSGTFWNSPDLWIRNNDDDGTVHESPEYGQDNWFYARVRNKSTQARADHFVVTFNAKSFAGTQFVYPADFLPAISAKAEFDLGPGETRIVKAKWPRNNIPLPGTHACLLASVISRQDHPANGAHVWEHNNLAQKNMTIINLQPDMFIVVPVVLLNKLIVKQDIFRLEIWRDKRIKNYEVGLVHKSNDFFRHNKGINTTLLKTGDRKPTAMSYRESPLECGGHLHDHFFLEKTKMLTSDNIAGIDKRFPGAIQVIMPAAQKSRIKFLLPPTEQTVIGLKIKAPRNLKKGMSFITHLVQRNSKTNDIIGGVAVEVRV